MRATIDLPDHLRAAVLAIAARKGYRGYSRVIVEAIEHYLTDEAAAGDGLDDVLALRGSWSDEDAEAVRSRIAALRASWVEEGGS